MLQISRDLQQHLPKVGVATYDMGSKDGVAFRFDPINGFPGKCTTALMVTFARGRLQMDAHYNFPIRNIF